MATTGSRFIRRTRRTVYENPWTTVWHDEVTRPDGSDGIYGVVHFAHSAVGVVALDDQDRIVLVGQHRYTLDAYSWEIPEGGVPDGETPLDGAKRELHEETGVQAASWQELARLTLSNSVTDECGVLYLATGLTVGGNHPDPTEALELQWVSLSHAAEMIRDGRITDALSVAAIALVTLDRVTGTAARQGQ
jgi:8-oxo-dGTP pyrophosphatase MutT (NUDIX family)